MSEERLPTRWVVGSHALGASPPAFSAGSGTSPEAKRVRGRGLLGTHSLHPTQMSKAGAADRPNIQPSPRPHASMPSEWKGRCFELLAPPSEREGSMQADKCLPGISLHL